MELPLQKLKPEFVQTALAMTGVQTDLQTSAIIQDVVHALIDKHTSYSLEDAAEIRVRHENVDEEYRTMILKERYRILSELHDPKSKNKLHIQISKEMDAVLKELKNK